VNCKLRESFKISVVVAIIVVLVAVGYYLLRMNNTNTTELEFKFESGENVSIMFSVGESKESVFDKLQSNGVEYEITDDDRLSIGSNFVIETNRFSSTGVYIFAFMNGKLFRIDQQGYNGRSQRLPIYKGGFS